MITSSSASFCTSKLKGERERDQGQPRPRDQGEGESYLRYRALQIGELLSSLRVAALGVSQPPFQKFVSLPKLVGVFLQGLDLLHVVVCKDDSAQAKQM